MKLYVKSQHHEYQFKIEEYSDHFILENKDGHRFKSEIKRIDDHRFSLLLNNESFIINSVKNDNNYSIIIRGKQFELEVLDEKTHAWKQIISHQNNQEDKGLVKSPMPGLIVKYLVQEGDDIKKGQALLVLSAMKMENEIKSPFSGRVKRIFYADATAVDKGVTLIQID